jgi:hypothetical protein
VVIGNERTCPGSEGKDLPRAFSRKRETGPDVLGPVSEGVWIYFQLFLLKLFFLVTRVAAFLLEVFSALAAAGFAGEIFFSAIPSHLLGSLAGAPVGLSC